MEFNADVYNEFDYEAIKILEDFLPDKIFDAHTHFFDKEFTPEASKQYGAEKVDLEDYKSFFSPLFKNKKK
ncbi:MAG: hypothetical protein E7408_05155, partial [Ruminococcaceae bacterium]|nr:hypothetical protein [Oscillospiraceae bacterium]